MTRATQLWITANRIDFVGYLETLDDRQLEQAIVFNALVGRARLAMPVHTGRVAPASGLRHHPSRPTPPCGQIGAPRWLLRGGGGEVVCGR